MPNRELEGEATEFFTRVLGGEWHVYSTNIWTGAQTETESQQQKLDLLARLVHLEPGAHVLDVGCGWGGPLTYLARRYGITGVGISLVPQQCDYASRRALSHDVPLDFHVSHWRDFVPDRPFDAVMTCGVVVHFPDLLQYFVCAKDWLRPGGCIVNEEMHFISETIQLDRTTKRSREITFLNELRQRGRSDADRLFVDEEGGYVTLDRELATAQMAGFEIERTVSIPLANYEKTVDRWVENCERARAELETMVGRDRYRWYRAYFRLFRRLINPAAMQLDVVVARLPDTR